MNAPTPKKSAAQCLREVNGDLDLMNEYAHWFELVCNCDCFAVLGFLLVDGHEPGKKFLVSVIYDLQGREKFEVEDPMVVLKDGHTFPPKSTPFDPYAYALNIFLRVKEQRNIFEAKIAAGGRHTGGDRHAPNLAQDDVVNILRNAFGVPKHPAENAARKAREDAGL